MVALKRIVKLAGTRSCGILERSPASRVGSQCATSGVMRQTWNIFNKCLTDWMSPESCQRKYLLVRALMSSAMVRAQSGRVILRSLRIMASMTFGNRYRPFSA